MGQSIQATGIAIIDSQHRAIHDLIQCYSSATCPLEESQCLEALSEMLRLHFKVVADFFEIKFPAEFQKRQTEILEWLTIRIEQRNLGMLSREALAGEIKGMFLDNVNDQGSKLHDLLRE